MDPLMTYIVFTALGGLIGLLIDDRRGCFPRPTRSFARSNPYYNGPSGTVRLKLSPAPQRPKREIADLGGTVVYRTPSPPPTPPAPPAPAPVSTPAPTASPVPPVVPPPPPPRPKWVKPEPESRLGNMGGVVTYRKRPAPDPDLAAAMNVRKRPPSPPPQATTATPLSFHPSMLRDEVAIPASLLYKMDTYTYDRALSERLVRRVAEMNPGKDGQWCAEKALWDLERDRK